MVICSVDCDIADYATVKVSSLRILSGHDQAVTSLSWSPHNISMLLSASMDGTAQVWDLSEEKPELANFRGHVGRIHAAAWCPTDDSLIASVSVLMELSSTAIHHSTARYEILR